MIYSEEWREHAACKGYDVSDFIGETRRSVIPIHVRDLCMSCPVKDDCLMEAMENDERGYWGGTTEEQRNKMRGKKPRSRVPATCGTESAYRRHKAKKEEPCDKCRRAYNDLARQRMAHKRARDASGRR